MPTHTQACGAAPHSTLNHVAPRPLGEKLLAALLALDQTMQRLERSGEQMFRLLQQLEATVNEAADLDNQFVAWPQSFAELCAHLVDVGSMLELTFDRSSPFQATASWVQLKFVGVTDNGSLQLRRVSDGTDVFLSPDMFSGEQVRWQSDGLHCDGTFFAYFN